MKAEAAVNTVRSADGTHIAFDRLGEGRPVILVTGASISRAIHAQLAELLDAGRRGGAMELFMRTVGLPEEMIAGMREEESALSRGFSESRRPDSNRGPLHYEGRMSRRRPTTRGHGRAHSRWKLSSSSAHAVDSLTPACPS
jgi:hypothetical protein